MEFLVALGGLVFVLVWISALIGIIHPIRWIGLNSRKRALGILLLSSLGVAMAAEISTELTRAGEAEVWQWVLSLLVIYGVFRLLRKGKALGASKRRVSASSPGSKPSEVGHSLFENFREEAPIQSSITADLSLTEDKDIVEIFSAQWIEPGGGATVAGRRIGGMVYLGVEPKRDGWRSGGGATIDTSLTVADVGNDSSGEGMPYWPRYSEISPQARATYLDWLAGGRSDERIGSGYVFLYFYGLERRFFVDAPAEEERQLLVSEVGRLLDIYGSNHSVQRYLTGFLDAAKIVLASPLDSEPRFERYSFELPLGLRVAIGQMAKEARPVSADWLLGWFVAHPESRLRTPAKRAFPEFRALFTLLFNERFPEGLRIRKPTRLLRAGYASASATFAVDLKPFFGDIPDITGTSRPLSIAEELVEEATVELDKYSRFLGRHPEGRDTVEAHALLPERLWPMFPVAGMEALRSWAEGVIEKGGFTPVEELVTRLEGATAEKLGRRQLTGAADALARLSIGMAPDPRFALRSPKTGESVVLFRLPGGITALEEVSNGYKNILVSIAMGSFVAHSDGTIAEKERAALEARILAADLPGAEQARLLANLQWMLVTPPDLGLFRRRLRDAPESARHEFGQVALAMAAADGTIDPGEVKAIERLYSAIGLPTGGVYSDLHALTVGSEPVTVRPAAVPAREFAVPPPPLRDREVILDRKRVESLMADTARVSSVLGEIFGDGQAEEELEVTPADGPTDFPGLDVRHAAFLDELLTRPHWNETEFVTLAGQFRLMHAGALETLNEWSFDHFGDVLVEEYDGYDVNSMIAAEFRK